MRCVTCGKPIVGRPENRWAPFCSERCKLVDLGKWFGEEYRVPAGPPQEGDAQDRLAIDSEDGERGGEDPTPQ